MTDEQAKQIQELHDFFLKKRHGGEMSRADELDKLIYLFDNKKRQEILEVIETIRAGKTAGRILMWICGLIIAVVTAWAAIRGASR